jgi:hypothetical protein
MKYLFLSFITILTYSLSVAQKQEKGNFTVEMELAPLGSEPLQINSFRMRKFTTDQTAIRLSTYIGGKRTPSVIPANEVDLKNVSSNFDVTLRPGLEKHFDGTKKLSPYIGTELFIGVGQMNQSTQSIWETDEIMTTKNANRSSKTGLNFICGTDYYFSDKIYLGVEMGFGFLREGRGLNAVKYKNPQDPTMTDTKTKGNSTSLNWGPNYQGTIRLGFCIK